MSTQRLNAWGQPLPPTLSDPPRILQRSNESPSQGRGSGAPTRPGRGTTNPSRRGSGTSRSRGTSLPSRGAHPSSKKGGRNPPSVPSSQAKEKEEEDSLFALITKQQSSSRTRAKQGKNAPFDPMAYITATREAKHKQRQAALKQTNPNQASDVATMKFRGKERETPKAKKPTKLKQAILQDRSTFHASPSSPSSLPLPEDYPEEEADPPRESEMVQILPPSLTPVEDDPSLSSEHLPSSPSSPSSSLLLEPSPTQEPLEEGENRPNQIPPRCTVRE